MEQYGVELVAKDADAFDAAMKRADDAVSDFGRATETASGKVNVAQAAMTGAFTAIAGVAVEAFGRAADAAVTFVGDAIDIAAEFEQGQSVLQAASGATEAQMKQLGDTAIALGNDLTLPSTSAVSASEAMTELVKAGLSVDDTMNAAKGALQLAAAAQIDEAEAAAITAQALNTFNLEGDQATAIADMLAAGANASSASMTDLSQGVQQAGFAFEANNQDADDLITALAQLTNVGLSGSDAGTALKNAMLKLAAPTKEGAAAMEALGINVFDAEGKMKPFREVIGIFNTQLAGMTQEQRNATLQTILQSDGMKAFIPILDAGVAGFDAMNAKVNESGAAAKMAGAQTDGFKGAQMALQSQLETLQLVIGTALLPILADLFTNVISPAVNTVMSLVQAFFAAGESTGSLTGALASVIPGFDQIMAVVESLRPLFETSFNAVRAVVEAAFTLIMAVFGEVQKFITAHADEIMAVFQMAWETIGEVIKTAAAFYEKVIAPALQAIAQWITEHSAEIQLVFTTVWNVIKFVVTTAIYAIQTILKIVMALINGDITGALEIIKNVFINIWTDIQKAVAQIIDDLAKSIATGMKNMEKSVATMFENIAKQIDAEIKRWLTFGEQLINSLIQGLQQAAAQVGAFFDKLFRDAINAAIGGLPPALRDLISGALGLGGGGVSGYGASSVSPPATTSQIAGASPGASNTSYSRNYNLNVNSGQSTGAIVQDFAVMQALAGG